MSGYGGIQSGWLRPESDFHGGTIAPEAQIRVTGLIERRTPDDIRDRVALIPNANDASVIGYGRFDSRYMAIDSKDIVWRRENQQRTGVKTDANMEVFSSFNGEVIEPGMTQEKFNQRYRAVGVTQGGSDPDYRMGGDNSGIAWNSQGSTTVHNNSGYDFNYGDYIIAVPPSIDRYTRDSHHEAMSKLRGENHIAGKYKGQFEPFSHKNTLGIFDEAVAELVNDPTKFNLPARMLSVYTGKPIDDSDSEEIALNLKRASMWTAFSAIATFLSTPALQGLTLIDIAATLGLVEAPGVRENETTQQEILSRSFLSTLKSTTLYDETVKTISREIGAAPVTGTAFFSTQTPRPSVQQQLLNEGDVAYDLLWRSSGHALERAGGNVFARVLRPSKAGQPMDINVHAT